MKKLILTKRILLMYVQLNDLLNYLMSLLKIILMLVEKA